LKVHSNRSADARRLLLPTDTFPTVTEDEVPIL
jgi:hypothetical protein